MKLILIVEDKQEELEKAKSIMSTRFPEYRVLVASDLESFKRLFEAMKNNLFGVITDLHFPANEGLKEQTQNNPNGLAVMATCVNNNVRVSICSDVNHHYSQYLDEPIKVLETHTNYTYEKIPFNQDRKDWSKAITDLLNL